MLPRGYLISPLFLQIIAYPIAYLFAPFCHFEVRGRKFLSKLRAGKPVVFVANHVSELDPILVRAALPCFFRLAPLFFASDKVENFSQDFGCRFRLYRSKHFLKAWGAYPVFRGVGDYQRSLSFQIEILEKGHSLLYFPEGYRTRTGSLQPGKPGIAYLARATNATVVPVGISGVFGINAAKFFSGKQKIIVSFGKPIEANEIASSSRLSKEELTKEAGRLMEAIRPLVVDTDLCVDHEH